MNRCPPRDTTYTNASIVIEYRWSEVILSYLQISIAKHKPSIADPAMVRLLCKCHQFAHCVIH